ncbi:MAG: TetR/AcrR family transcriptional regulator [Nevskiaceae bacterium]|nr:MAG: TetR/AcrR family transcriptional regulator [Nevskiaceae bacterium]TBR72535.1 MAG: TetR/AcrR family transcriptional regulator [Nevskiaceae bacterium]
MATPHRIAIARRRTPATRSRRELRVEQILQAARDLFGAQGYDATTTAQIAAQIGVVEGLIYKYFPTKRALLLQVLGYWYDDMFGDYTRELAYFPTARKRLHYLIWRHLCTVRDYPRLCGLMFREVLSADNDYRGSPLHAMNKRYTQLLVDTVETGMRGGEFRTDLPPRLVRSLVYGGIEHEASRYLARYIAPHQQAAADAPALDVGLLADQITNLLCDGLGPRPAAELTETRA